MEIKSELKITAGKTTWGEIMCRLSFFFSFLGIGALCKEIKRIERSEARLSLKHQRPGWGTKGKKRSDVTGIGSSYWVPAKVWVVRANAVYRVP